MKRLLRIPAVFLAFSLLFALQKPIFAIVVGGYSFADLMAAMWHGLPMDMSMAGYFTALPALLCTALAWRKKTYCPRIYFGIVSAVMALACVVNPGLYKEWNFPLDLTPVFYLVTSPKEAFASVSWWYLALGLVFVAALAWAYWMALVKVWNLKPWREKSKPKRPWLVMPLLLLETGALFLPIRGGVGVATMNASRVYFSEDMRLNHAAVNPIFNVMYSAAHQEDFASEFRFMENSEAEAVMQKLYCAPDSSHASLPYKPDIQLIILEGFSSHLIPSLGGEPIAVNLDSIAGQGLLFTNIYSSSFRTDRALPAILNGYPAQPTTTICKYVDKLANIPALARSLANAGYETEYLYGGDPNFSNKTALLVAGGYAKLVADSDFPTSQRLSKWGAHDEIVFARALAEIQAPATGGKPRLTAIQTLSSHEPFDVPYSKLADKRANAFAYTDSCLGDYMCKISQLPQYAKTLVVIVPDHLGGYPRVDDPEPRHRIPLIITGGAAKDLKLDTDLLSRIGSQTDIAATILDIAGVDHSDFPFSNSLLNPDRPEFAFFSEPAWIAFKTPGETAILSVETRQPLAEASDSAMTMLKAYIQSLYDDLDAR